MANSNKLTPSSRKYDKTFKAEALRMLDEGQSVAQVAKSRNVSDQLLHIWKHAHKKQLQKQTGNADSRCVSPVLLRRLQKNRFGMKITKVLHQPVC
ncbi:transposase [Spirosoma terrae]|uniref:Transposase n=1 Tax=Spirosoma terrae TaxID=1968276 RepID=A0A6L9LC09_9BACT|nr:transposase [Spirosoma terrae]NDU97087.1 transposase [Spirosoma terrae]